MAQGGLLRRGVEKGDILKADSLTELQPLFGFHGRRDGSFLYLVNKPGTLERRIVRSAQGNHVRHGAVEQWQYAP